MTAVKVTSCGILLGVRRYQVQLQDDAAERVREQARHRGVSFSEVVREAVDRYVAQGPAVVTLAERWASAIGAGTGDVEGRTDVGVNHDLYAWDH